MANPQLAGLSFPEDDTGPPLEHVHVGVSIYRPGGCQLYEGVCRYGTLLRTLIPSGDYAATSSKQE